jgi:hypothetical protein
VNTSDWVAILPRKTQDEKSKERFISRFLSNKLIDPLSVMAGLIPGMVTMMSARTQTIILMLDQSKISAGFECLMISLRIGEREPSQLPGGICNLRVFYLPQV